MRYKSSFESNSIRWSDCPQISHKLARVPKEGIDSRRSFSWICGQTLRLIFTESKTKL